MNNIIDDFDKKKCCGCLACVNSCPKKALYKAKDNYGFTIPKINKDLCIDCGKCLKVCPYHTNIKEYEPIDSYAAVNKSNNIVKDSSSGGIFYSLAKFIIENHGFVFGAVLDDNYKVRHICIDNLNELKVMQKSKYVQSDLSDIYSIVRDKIKTGKMVLFSGTPCQIAGLRSFLFDKDYDNLYCIDIVCHGVPCQDIYDDYLNCLQKKVGKIDSYEFRTKKRAKNGMNCFYSYKKGERNFIKNWPEDSFNYLYMKNLIYRDSCYICKFAKKNRNSDITLCDYWGWDKYHSTDFEKFSTVSGCIVNTLKGKKIFNNIKDEIIFKQTKYDYIVENNSCLIKPSELNPERLNILKKWKEQGYETIDKEFKKKKKYTIIKYKVLRNIPFKFYSLMYSFRNMVKRR